MGSAVPEFWEQILIAPASLAALARLVSDRRLLVYRFSQENAAMVDQTRFTANSINEDLGNGLTGPFSADPPLGWWKGFCQKN
jgi:hypothetical protein